MAPRVLIADDSAVVRRTLVGRVESAGFEVVEHASCAGASTVDAHTLSCALLDFDLGDGFGDDVAGQLRSQRPSLPIAFFTSTADEATAARIGAHGPLFAKPEELESALAWITKNARG